MTARNESHPARPKQVRALRTRESVLAAAALVFDRQGFVATRMGDIAVEAGVTKGALYFHFPSKEQIAAAIVEQHLEQCASLVRDTQRWGLDGMATLERFINELAIRYQRDAVTRAGIRLTTEHPRTESQSRVPFEAYISWVRGLLDDARIDGTLNAEVDPTAAARIIVGSLFGILEMSTHLTSRRDLVPRVREWWSFIRPTLTAGTSGPPP